MPLSYLYVCAWAHPTTLCLLLLMLPLVLLLLLILLLPLMLLHWLRLQMLTTLCLQRLHQCRAQVYGAAQPQVDMKWMYK